MNFKYKGFDIELRFKNVNETEQPMFSCNALKLFNYSKLESLKRVITNKMITRSILRRCS